MASLTGTKIKDTYDGLLKTTDNGGLGATEKLITDGLGNSSNLYMGTTGAIGIGAAPSGYGASFVVNSSSTGIYINNNGGTATFKMADAGVAEYSFTLPDGTGDFAISKGSSERMRIDSSGVVQVRNQTPTIQLYNTDTSLGLNQILGDLDWYQSDPSGTGVGVVAKIRGINVSSFEGAGAIAFHTGTTSSLTERMRITSGGDVLFGGITGDPDGTTTYGSAFTSESSGRMLLKMATSTTGAINLIQFYNANGNIGKIQVSGTATSYITSSDYRLKEDWKPMEDALTRIDALKPVNFAWKADGSRVDGFLAHEVQEVVPEAISGTKDGMRDEEYEVSPAVYEDVVHPAEEAVYETIEHPAIAEELDADGNIIVEAQEAWTEQVLVSEAKEEWTEKVLVSEAVMGTRSVPDYQGIDQSKIVPLLVAAIQELKAEVDALKVV